MVKHVSVWTKLIFSTEVHITKFWKPANEVKAQQNIVLHW